MPCIRACRLVLPNDLSDGGAKFRLGVGDDAQGSEIQRGAGALGRGPEHVFVWVGFIQQKRDAPGARRDLMQDRDQLSQDDFGLGCDPGNVAARLGQAGDKPAGDWVVDARHNDGDRRRRALHRARGRRVSNQDHIDTLPDQFLRHVAQMACLAIGIDGLILDVLAL
jgi:hypothetical protein